MTVAWPHVVVPYPEFLEHRERRCRIAAELGRQDAQRTIDAKAVVAAVATPLSTEPEFRHGFPCRVTLAERPHRSRGSMDDLPSQPLDRPPSGTLGPR